MITLLWLYTTTIVTLSPLILRITLRIKFTRSFTVFYKGVYDSSITPIVDIMEDEKHYN